MFDAMILGEVFSKKVKNLLFLPDFSNRGLSDSSGFSHQTISLNVRGRANPSLRIVEALAAVLEADLADLLACNPAGRR